MIKSWGSYIASVMVGTIGFLNKCKEVLDLVFVLLGILGLILSIQLTIRKLKKFK